MKLFWTISLVIFGMPFLLAQTKYEKEERIDLSEVPQKALQFVNELQLPKKIRWYLETGLESQSYEAKTKINRRWLSLEFDNQGIIEDIELKLRNKDLSDKEKDLLDKALETTFQKHRCAKIQKHWSAKRDLQNIIQNKSFEEAPFDFYELVIYGVRDSSKETFEVTVSPDGNLMSVSKIISRLSDNLEF